MTTFPPVDALIPQRAPMRLVDEVLAADDGAITCAAVVRADNLFLRQGRVPAAVALEYMAQAIAAHAGLGARARGEPPAVGLIAACRSLELHGDDDLAPGDRLVIDAARTFDGPLTEYRARVARGGELLAEAVLHVARPNLENPLP